ncbi:MAG: helix-turn-helix domain-containing protein, partial [Dermatophilaceae bacterium]
MAATVAATNRVLTTERESGLAEAVLQQLRGPEGSISVDRAGHHVADIPPELGVILQQVLETMARGGAVTVTSIPAELTTSSAAAMLGVSRPTLMKMIRDGRLDAHKVGTHTRLTVEDVLAELRARRSRERAEFDALR